MHPPMLPPPTPELLFVFAVVGAAAVLAFLYALAASVRTETEVWDVRNRCQELVYRQRLELCEELETARLEKEAELESRGLSAQTEAFGVDILDDDQVQAA